MTGIFLVVRRRGQVTDLLSDAEGTYRAWATWLQAFGEGKATDPAGLPPLTVRHGDQVLLRFGQRCDAALAALFRRVTEAYKKGMEGARSASDVEWHLVSLRTLLRPAVALAHTTLLPEAVRAEIDRAVTDAVHRFQDELEAAAARPGPHSAALESVVKRARITAVLDEAPCVLPPGSGGAGQPEARGRRVLGQETS